MPKPRLSTKKNEKSVAAWEYDKVSEIKFIAWLVEGWELIEEQKDRMIYRRKRDDTIITIFLRKMTIKTRLFHPKYNKFTTLVRIKVPLKMLKKIFEYPRQHTGRGILLKKHKNYGLNNTISQREKSEGSD